MEPKKIKILLVDDDPKLTLKIRDIPLFPNHPDAELSLPYVYNDCLLDGATSPDIEERMMVVEEAFELKWLKSPKDIKNFLNLGQTISDQFGKKKLAEVGFVPDLIIFDYSLTLAMNDPIRYKEDILRSVNPNLKMHEFLESQSVSLPLADRNLAHSIETQHDTLGLFLSTLILEMFSQDQPCIGIPITYYGETLKGKEAEVFEWVVYEYYKEISDWEGKGNKQWYEIIDFALPLYRKSFLKLVGYQKVQINTENLYNLWNSKAIGEELYKHDLIFSTVYGRRTIAVEYLFIDTNPFVKTEIPDYLKDKIVSDKFSQRDFKIYEFINDIAISLSRLANLGLGLNDFIEAKMIADRLRKHYDDHFEERIDLSEFAAKGSSLTKSELNMFRTLKMSKTFLVKTGMISKECSISAFAKTKQPGVARLAILYLIGKISTELAMLTNTSQHKMKYHPLEDEEIYYILNPSANTERGHNLVLPMHLKTKTKKRQVLSDFGISVTRIWQNSHPQTKASDFYDFGKWIEGGEKIIIRSMLDIDPMYYPIWLR